MNSAPMSTTTTDPRDVIALNWTKTYASEFLSSANTIVGVYRVWSHHEAKGKWFWQFTGHQGLAEGTVDTEAEGKAASVAHFNSIMRTALTASGLSIVPVASGDVATVWFEFDEGTGEFTGVYCTEKPHELRGMRAFVPASTLESLAAENVRLTRQRDEAGLRVAYLEEEVTRNRDMAISWKDSAEAAEALRAALQARVKELEKGLEPFALVAEWDIGDSEADTDRFRPMDGKYAAAPLLTVGDLRRAASLLSTAGGKDGD